MRVGNHQTLDGAGMYVVGNHNTVTGDNNHVVGNHNTIHGNHNTVTGNHNNIHGQVGNEALGRYNRINGVEVPPPEGSDQVTVNDFGSSGGIRTIRGSRGNMIIHHPGAGVTSIGSVGDGGVISMSVGSASRRKPPPDKTGGKAPKKSDQKKQVSRKREREEPADAEPVFIECPTEAEMKEHDKEADEGAPACVVCISNKPMCAVVPCMHKCLCCACARTLTGEGTKEQGQVACPLCKEKVEKIKKVYE